MCVYVSYVCYFCLYVPTYTQGTHTHIHTHTHTHTTIEIEKRFVTSQILYKTCTAYLHFDNIPIRN